MIFFAMMGAQPASAGEKNQCSIREESQVSPSRGPASQAEDNGAIVIPLDRSVSVEALRKQGYRVKSYEQFNASNPWRDPSPSLRDRVFQSARIGVYVSDWDDFDKDVLFLRAQEQKLPFLRSKYPTLPPALLAHLQKMIFRMKAMEKGDAE